MISIHRSLLNVESKGEALVCVKLCEQLAFSHRYYMVCVCGPEDKLLATEKKAGLTDSIGSFVSRLFLLDSLPLSSVT
jgi:hypothetical protein